MKNNIQIHRPRPKHNLVRIIFSMPYNKDRTQKTTGSAPSVSLYGKTLTPEQLHRQVAMFVDECFQDHFFRYVPNPFKKTLNKTTIGIKLEDEKQGAKNKSKFFTVYGIKNIDAYKLFLNHLKEQNIN